jgi:hypothetical protein
MALKYADYEKRVEQAVRFFGTKEAQFVTKQIRIKSVCSNRFVMAPKNSAVKATKNHKTLDSYTHGKQMQIIF